MKREAGYLALFAFLMTGARFATGPANIKETSAVQAQASTPVPATFLREETTCHAFDPPPEKPTQGQTGTTGADAKPNPDKYGDLARLIDRFFFRSSEAGRPSAGTLPAGIHLMIATVPDPRRTHLSLQFDRTLEAIQQAAQDEGYIYDSSWLQWKAERVAYNSRADRTAEMKEAAEQELCPGLVVFRRSPSQATPENCKDKAGAGPLPVDVPYRCGLFVFVVGEEPTAGLNRVQWENAMGWIDKHASKDRTDQALRVLGPNFSGSTPSFVRAVKDLKDHKIEYKEKDGAPKKYAPTFTSTLLYSGRVSGCRSWRWLQEQLPPSTDENPSPNPVRLADFEQNDALQTDRLSKFLVDRGQHLKEVAILSEDETAYGGLPDAQQATDAAKEDRSCNPAYDNSDRPVHLYYPRDISALRSAYAEQSIFSPAQRSESGGSQGHTVLRPESKGGADEATDSITPFSGTDLALTQEAQMYGIVNTLKTHGIRYIVLRSTNSLDFLFLTRFMHRAYPNAYIITTGSDLLFGREIDSTEFRGVAALSSYPLLPLGQDWTFQIENVPQHAHRIFGANTMEGEYLACRFLITDPEVSSNEARPFIHKAKANIPDYASPFWDSATGESAASTRTAQPATWLSVIGRDGYWPLATLKDTLRDSGVPISTIETVEKPEDKKDPLKENNVGPQYLDLTGSWRLVCALVLILFGVHRFACRHGWHHQNLSMFVHFTPIEGRRGQGLIAAGWAALCCMLLILFLSCARLCAVTKPGDIVWVFLTGAATVTACCFAVVEVRWWNRTRRDDATGKWHSHPHFHWVVSGCMIGAIVIFGVAGWWIFDFYSDRGSAMTTVYRAVHLTSGVSPLVPILAILAGFYWWFWQSLSGLALLGEGRPVLPRTQCERDKDEASRRDDGNRLARSIEQSAVPFPSFGKSTLLLYLLPLFLVMMLPIALQRNWMHAFEIILESLESTVYNHTLHALIGIAVYLMFMECLQFYSTWLVLKRLLVELDGMRLRRTFAALQGLSMGSLWRLSGSSSRGRSRVFSRQMEALGHLEKELENFAWLDYGSHRLKESVRSTLIEGGVFSWSRKEYGCDFAILNNGLAKAIRLSVRDCTEIVMEDLLMPGWNEEHTSIDVVEPATDGKPVNEKIKLSDNLRVRAGEEFVCLTYVSYLQNLLGRMRTMVLSMAGLFAAIALAVGMYPFTPRPTISLSLLLLLLVIGAVVGVVFAGLDRDNTLSHITNTEPGSLGGHFWIRMVSFIGVPALGLIVSQFPEITDFVFSWIAPTMSAAR